VLTSLGVAPSLATFSRLEVLMNAAIVAAVSPAGLDGAVAGGRAWAAYRFVAAVLIETIHGLLLPARSASFGDVVANTAGMLAGSVLFLMIRPLRHG
jgi:VanZ family protein